MPAYSHQVKTDLELSVCSLLTHFRLNRCLAKHSQQARGGFAHHSSLVSNFQKAHRQPQEFGPQPRELRQVSAYLVYQALSRCHYPRRVSFRISLRLFSVEQSIFRDGLTEFPLFDLL